MNIFMLDTDPDKAAIAHCDKHVVKMILESAQLLCTALNEAGVPMPYRVTHKNHPCSIWVRESRANALWLYDLTDALNYEYRFRYRKTTDHKSYAMLRDMCALSKLDCLPDNGWTAPAMAMPDQYKQENVVDAYRAYYRHEKSNILQYTRRQIPEWL